MSLRTAVAAPFKQSGSDRIDEQEFVVALSFDRDWCSTDQAKRLVDIAAAEGLLRREEETLVATFDPGTVTVPDGFVPDESVFTRRAPFERVLAELVEDGHDKREAVAGINDLQQRLGVPAGVAAVVYARGQGIEVPGVAEQVREDL
ncbi:MAG: DUF2240 family protein [Halobacteriaceae archaeon]